MLYLLSLQDKPDRTGTAGTVSYTHGPVGPYGRRWTGRTVVRGGPVGPLDFNSLAINSKMKWRRNLAGVAKGLRITLYKQNED